MSDEKIQKDVSLLDPDETLANDEEETHKEDFHPNPVVVGRTQIKRMLP
jgi:hypothetical protein